MQRRAIHFRFYNPNTEKETAEYLLQLLIEANKKKLEKALQEAAGNAATRKYQQEGDSA